jgi:chromate reductase, NAD(P)H dehydrogenase (quinone)
MKEYVVNILAISGSIRRSSNTRLARLVAELRPHDEVSVFNHLNRLPFYDADLEATGVAHAVASLRAAVTAAGFVVVVTPE